MKRIVICCDGTWNRPEGSSGTTNVALTARLVLPSHDGTDQLVFYDQGVGTGNLLDRATGGAFGDGLDQNIEDAYTFLVNNYEAGDEVYVFGFSRGAYTARSMVGLISACGLLLKSEAKLFRLAYNQYRTLNGRARALKGQGLEQFPGTHARRIKIKFLGVWDTVGALGIPLPHLNLLYFFWAGLRNKYKFHNTSLSSIVDNAYQALAVDEMRPSYQPVIWTLPDGETALPKGQAVEQVWFAGLHTDIGGGNLNPGLSNISLDWMLEKAQACGLGIDEKERAGFVARQDPEMAVVKDLGWKGILVADYGAPGIVVGVFGGAIAGVTVELWMLDSLVAVAAGVAVIGGAVGLLAGWMTRRRLSSVVVGLVAGAAGGAAVLLGGGVLPGALVGGIVAGIVTAAGRGAVKLLLRQNRRPIGMTEPTLESVYYETKDRVGKVPGYPPPNLAEYLARPDHREAGRPVAASMS